MGKVSQKYIERHARKKRAIPKETYVYIKQFKDSYEIAHVIISTKPWNEIMPSLAEDDTVNRLFDDDSYGWNGVIAVGKLRLMRIQHPVNDRDIWLYSPTYTRVMYKHRGGGIGKLLYRAMLVAAKAHAKKARRKKVYFASDSVTGGSTSASAWRCYKNLKKSRYIKNLGPAVAYTKDQLFEAVRIPRIPATLIKAA